MASYFVDIGTDAKQILGLRIERKSDAAAKRAMRLAVKNMINVPSEWTVTGRLYRWDEAAQAPASVAIATAQRVG